MAGRPGVLDVAPGQSIRRDLLVGDGSSSPFSVSGLEGEVGAV